VSSKAGMTVQKIIDVPTPADLSEASHARAARSSPWPAGSTSHTLPQAIQIRRRRHKLDQPKRWRTETIYAIATDG
jgi:hypothetical protein